MAMTLIYSFAFHMLTYILKVANSCEVSANSMAIWKGLLIGLVNLKSKELPIMSFQEFDKLLCWLGLSLMCRHNFENNR